MDEGLVGSDRRLHAHREAADGVQCVQDGALWQKGGLRRVGVRPVQGHVRVMMMRAVLCSMLRGPSAHACVPGLAACRCFRRTAVAAARLLARATVVGVPPPPPPTVAALPACGLCSEHTSTPTTTHRFVYSFKWKLPAGFTCKQCKLVLYYLTGSRCWPPCLSGNCKKPVIYSYCGQPGSQFPEE